MLLKHKIYAGSVILLFSALIVLYSIINFVVGPDLESQAKNLAQMQAQIIEKTVEGKLSDSAALTNAIAYIAEKAPLDVDTFISNIEPLVQSASSIAGGGVWPEPNKLVPGKDKASLFWAKTGEHQFQLLDDYNKQDSSPYQQESWYTSVKNAGKGECVWSEAYLDTVSNVAMVTCSVKVERDGQFWGVATIDVELDFIDHLLASENEKYNTYSLILDSADQLVSFPNFADTELAMTMVDDLVNIGEPMRSLVTPLKERSNQPVSLDKGVIAGEQSILITAKLEDQNWLVGVVAPSSVVNKQVSMINSTLYSSFLALILLFILVLVYSGHALVAQINRITNQVKNLTGGSSSDKLPVDNNNEVSQLCLSINDYGEHLTKILAQIKAEAEQIKSNAEVMNSLSSNSQNRANLLMDENHSLASAINQMSTTASEVSENVTTVANITEQSSSLVNDGFSIIEQNAASINQLSTKLTESTDSIELLSQSSSDIGKVLDVIMSISEQTNLLALNAAIEAARAGESGRGFAVVADEVRSLAQKTQQSAVEIEQMISQLQKASNESKSVIEECMEYSQMVSTHSETTSSQYHKIVEAFQDIKERSTSIAVAAEEQAQVTQDVDNLASRIRDITSNNQEDSSRFTSVSKDANEQAQRLYQLSQQ